MDAKDFQTCPTRRLVRLDQKPPPNQHGFLSKESFDATGGIDSLYHYRAVLVVAAPWTGKTFLARQFNEHLLQDSNKENREAPFGPYFDLILFEWSGPGNSIKPPWWDKWRKGTRRACWIVDALDEDAHKNRGQAHLILNLIEDLDDSERNRLLFIGFARENDIPAAVKERLEELYPGTDKDKKGRLQLLRLAPLTEDDARQFVGSPNEFKKVLTLITENKLESISSLPVVLEMLKRQKVGSVLDTVMVWRDVLKGLLCDKRPETQRTSQVPFQDDLFNATARIASTLTFSGNAGVSEGMRSSAEPSIEDIFPINLPRS